MRKKNSGEGVMVNPAGGVAAAHAKRINARTQHDGSVMESERNKNITDSSEGSMVV